MQNRGLPARALAALALICLVWAANAVMLRYAVGLRHLPPVHLAAGRFVVVALALAPLLRRPLPRPGRVMLAGALMGAGHFGFLMLGYARVDAASSALILQLGIPVTALLSMSLGIEAWSPRRVLLIAGATAAVLLAIGGGGGDPLGMALIAGAALSLSFGSVLVKGTVGVTALALQAWTSVISAVLLVALAPLLEPQGVAALAAQPGLALLSILAPAVIVTGMAHTAYYHLLKRHDPSIVASTTLLFPILTILMGLLLLGESVTPLFWAGAAVALVCVLVLTCAPGRPRA